MQNKASFLCRTSDTANGQELISLFLIIRIYPHRASDASPYYQRLLFCLIFNFNIAFAMRTNGFQIVAPYEDNLYKSQIYV
jgi:hypothetical protein